MVTSFNVDNQDWSDGTGLGGGQILEVTNASLLAGGFANYGPFDVTQVPYLYMSTSGGDAKGYLIDLIFNASVASDSPFWSDTQYLTTLSSETADLVACTGPYLWVTVNSESTANQTFSLSLVGMSSGGEPFGGQVDRTMLLSGIKSLGANASATLPLVGQIPGPAVFSMSCGSDCSFTLYELQQGGVLLPFGQLASFAATPATHTGTVTVAIPNNACEVLVTAGAAALSYWTSVVSMR